jgi:AraC family transcriptional regulator
MPSSDICPIKLDDGCYLNGLEFHQRSYRDHNDRSPHSHEETFLILIVQGQVEEIHKKQSYVRTPSTLIVLPAGETHSTRFCGGVRTFEIALQSAWQERLRPYSALVERPATYQQGNPVRLALRLYNEFRQQDSVTPLMLEGLLLELLAQLERNKTGTTDRSGPRWLRQASDFLRAHYTESLSVDAIAAAVGVHPAHLVRTFRQRNGCTIGDFIRDLRVEHASRLLSTSGLSLGQIALDSGFADQSHFCRIYKNRTGMTPSEYQKVCGCAGLRQNDSLIQGADG